MVHIFSWVGRREEKRRPELRQEFGSEVEYLKDAK